MENCSNYSVYEARLQSKQAFKISVFDGSVTPSDSRISAAIMLGITGLIAGGGER